MAVAAACVTLGELGGAGAVVAVGVMAGTVVVVAAVVVTASWYRWGRRVVVDLVADPWRTSVGEPIGIWVRATDLGPTAVP
ncbi:MAG: hypothetical protein M0Z82_06680, partial [Actinomycetota bacterium]|nr:hypothetical protein [Actinomycetota bacterium]